MIRYSDEMKVWLFDLAHGNLEEKDIIVGFIKYYVLFDCTIQDVKRDIIFHLIMYPLIEALFSTLEKPPISITPFSRQQAIFSLLEIPSTYFGISLRYFEKKATSKGGFSRFVGRISSYFHFL